MTEKSIWAFTDVEVLTVSSMLASDVHIATEQYDSIKLWTRTTWNRNSSCIDLAVDPNSISLYIANVHHNHYEPVNSTYELRL